MTNYLWVVEIFKNREWVPYIAMRRKEDAELVKANEVSHVMTDLKKRSAADCVLTRTDYGFVCKEMATNKIYKVRVK